tara:strand:+ start:1276 stop:1542 length:267 start_codon:yes stop_codon:yes gene_type:complete
MVLIRYCKRCGEEIAENRRIDVKWCTDSCKSLAYLKRKKTERDKIVAVNKDRPEFKTDLQILQEIVKARSTEEMGRDEDGQRHHRVNK